MSRLHLAESAGSRPVKLPEAISDSVLELPESFPLSEAEREKIDRRLEAYRRDPEAVSPWPEGKERVLGRAGL